VVVPGTECEFTMLPNHEPPNTALRNGGVILVNAASGSNEFVVFGGVTEVNERASP
jgi:F0F1-type ATP synthase epsilon subunit